MTVTRFSEWAHTGRQQSTEKWELLVRNGDDQYSVHRQGVDCKTTDSPCPFPKNNCYQWEREQISSLPPSFQVQNGSVWICGALFNHRFSCDDSGDNGDSDGDGGGDVH